MLFVLVIGNTGTGKTTFIKSLNRRERRRIIHIDDYRLDSNNFQGEINEALMNEMDIILEANYMTSFERSEIIRGFKTDFNHYNFICFDFGPGNEISLQRKIRDFSEISNYNIEEVHSKYKIKYQEPRHYEGFSRIIKCYY